MEFSKIYIELNIDEKYTDQQKSFKEKMRAVSIRLNFEQVKL